MRAPRIPHDQTMLMLHFEDTPFHDELFVGHYQFAKAREVLPSHRHPPGRMEICYLVKGQQMYEANGQQHLMRANDLFITFPNESHSSGIYPEEKASLYWMQIRCPQPGEPLLTLRPEYAEQLTQALLAMPQRCFRGHRRIPAIFEDIIDSYYTDTSALRAMRIAAKVIDFLHDVVQCAWRSSGETGIPEDIGRCLAAIDANLESSLAVDELAAIAELSTSRFKAKFKQVTGIPPAEYVLRRKIERAKTLLGTSDASITDIAFSLGFTSSQHFATVFRRYTTMSPRQFGKGTVRANK